MEAHDASPPWRQNKAAAAIDSSSAPLAAAAARLSGRSRALPSSRDFHFYNNFPSFKAPVRDVADKADASLAALAACPLLPKQQPPFPKGDLDDAHDWLVALNDDLIERFGASMDEFKALREKEEAAGRKATPEEADDGFQVVYGKKKKRASGQDDGGKGEAFPGSGSVRMASKDKATSGKAKVPFHIPTIPRPQDAYNILVNNTNKPLEHVWLERSEDGTRPVHPLEKISVEQLINRTVPESEPAKPPPLEDTPFTLVEDVKALKEMVNKLKSATEFAVDLEHNHYRSFQGLTCLMQISTRTEDFIVDTLKIRIHLGLYLRELFKDPTKRKVIHGADRDIIWLQRDFGLYVCNLFDTGQASRVLQLERNSLEYLLHHFCEVTANKEYQSADWRLRPLPDEMIKYAREDTHYLLYIYDLMKLRLLKESTGENDLLLEVHKRSNEICLQLYEKELLTDTSYLYIYGLQENELSAKQLAVLAALYQWRDGVARDEDESTGYILPNKVLLEIAKQTPTAAGMLKRLVKSKYPFVERHLGHIISIIRNAIANSVAFESIAEQLKKGRLEELTVENMEGSGEDCKIIPSVDADNNGTNLNSSDQSAMAPSTSNISAISDTWNCTREASLIGSTQLEDKMETISSSATMRSGTLSGQAGSMDKGMQSNGGLQQAARATVQVLKRPTAFGALLGNSTSGRKSNLFGVLSSEQGKSKVEKIQSSVVFPFHHFSGGVKSQASSYPVEPMHPEPESIQHGSDHPTSTTQVEEVIQLDSEMDEPQVTENHCEVGGSHSNSEEVELSRSLYALSSGFVLDQRSNLQPNPNARRELEFNFELKPFDYATARKNVTFGGLEAGTSKDDAQSGKSKDSGDKQRALDQPRGGAKEGTFQNPRRRQAFPPSGNRTATYH